MLSATEEVRLVPEWGVIPTIRVQDMADALALYTGALGFTLERGGADEGNCALVRGDARLMLETPSGFYGDAYNAAIEERLGAKSPNALYFEEADIDGFRERVEAAGARIVDPLAERPWGQREFTVEDSAGNWLTFWAASAR
jgi:catechol 2,3-dioxygenase-like lactoylglutathione lyase family enzyme